MRHALLIAGPTASGKSSLALHLARRLGGTVINADSMQVYRELRVLTARPTPEEEALAPHALYGIRPAASPGSAAWWRGEALAAMAGAGLPILCGGTGLYFAALTQGLSPIPEVDAAARAEARDLLRREGPAALHARLAAVDPGTAAAIRATDPQRVCRAWEVWRSSGRGLAAWQAAAAPPTPWRFRTILLDPPRTELRQAIAGRFGAMLGRGAVDEAAALLRLGLDPALPAMRAHGVPELGAFLRGETTLDEAAARVATVTGQYAKRQATWFRHRPPSGPMHVIHARFARLEQFSERERVDIESFLVGLGSIP